MTEHKRRGFSARTAIALIIACLVSAGAFSAITAHRTGRHTTEKEIEITRTRTVTQVEYIEKPVTEAVAIPIEIPVYFPVEVPTWVTLPEGAKTNRYSVIQLSLEDIELLARTAWREARGERMLGMRMVIEVVLNRVLSRHFPNTVTEVLYQPGQFTPYGEALELEDITPTQAQYDAVYAVLRETPITDPDVVFFAQSPIYGDLFMHVGGHYFTYYPDDWS